ncbi:MAG: hypothetical protein Q9164_004759 [Protoblastenia rupestris]
MAAAQALEHPLEVLPAMLNLVLVQTGKILRNPDLHNSQNLGLTRRRISEFVPPANDRFHDALDDIEIEILQAKAVMERDLSVLRKKRAERERQVDKTITPTSPKDLEQREGNREATVVGPLDEGQGVQSNAGDAVMADAAAQIVEQSKEEPTAKELQTLDDEQTVSALDYMPQDSQNTTGLAISIPQDASMSDLGALAHTNNGAIGASQPDFGIPIEPNGPSGAAVNDDFDFDSMFNDAELVVPDGSLNFELDFSTNETEAQNLLPNNPMEGITMSNVNIASTNPTTSEDLNSLLPGLENYVNATNETTTNNATANTVEIPNVNQNAMVDTSGAITQVTTAPALADSSLDDFFNPADFNTTNANGSTEDLIGDGNFEGFEDFDDDWFKME